MINEIARFVFMLCGVSYSILGLIIIADSGSKGNGILFIIAGILYLILLALKEKP